MSHQSPRSLGQTAVLSDSVQVMGEDYIGVARDRQLGAIAPVLQVTSGTDIGWGRIPAPES